MVHSFVLAVADVSQDSYAEDAMPIVAAKPFSGRTVYIKQRAQTPLGCLMRLLGDWRNASTTTGMGIGYIATHY